jgi:glycosyltransferase involved in cell wall biosynthesis
MPAPSLGFAMIVKNGGETLRQCLESVRGVANEMIVADTGSTDDTCAIAQEFGATVLSIPWEGDFARARNAALAQATTDWILTLDADEELDADARPLLPRLLVKPKVGGYAVPVRNYLPLRHGSVNGNRAKANDGRNPRAKDAPAYAEHLVVRLFRRHERIRYAGCVHEVIAPQIAALGLKLAKANFCIHHYGYLASQKRYAEKSNFYLDLLRNKVANEPGNPMAWLELARQLHEPFRRNEEALGCLARAFALQPGMAEAWFLAGVIHLEMGSDKESLGCLERCGGGGEHAGEREHYRGDALHNLGMLEQARMAYQQSLKLTGDDPQVESKLGYVEVRLGDSVGFLRMQNAIVALPHGAELHERLIKGYLAAGKLADAALAAEKFAAAVPHPKTFLRAAAIRAHLKENEQACRLISRGLEIFPESGELKNAYAELSSQQSSPPELELPSLRAGAGRRG